MLVIGHRGASGLAPENTLASIKAGFDSGADMIEIDVRMTRDGVPVVIHDSNLARTHHIPASISSMTLTELKSRTKSGIKVPTLEAVLDRYYGRILMMIEIKNSRSGQRVAEFIKSKYISKPSDWDNIIFSSFKPSELAGIRKISKRINLALLHHNNPFLFIAYHRKLRLAAVGFHRLHTNKLAFEIAKKIGLFTYVYTVDRRSAALMWAQAGYDGVITDYPDKIQQELNK
ncbi:MAG: glycerophosphodiester phosphodiesterase [Candidatus Saccharimonadaceae bacterium]